ncbi:hypothetical protein ACIRD9_41120 [Streptomyces violaceus]|uniref:hypothetical protein n=1 Tax=Streptomyces violaceus TaxID=1936 RepID=UPI0038069FC6
MCADQRHAWTLATPGGSTGRPAGAIPPKTASAGPMSLKRDVPAWPSWLVGETGPARRRALCPADAAAAGHHSGRPDHCAYERVGPRTATLT